MSIAGWPLTAQQITDLHATGETDLVEFKREWPDLSTQAGKAHLAKMVMALANTVPPDKLALLILGIDETDLEWEPSLRVAPPSHEAVQSILATAVMPPPRVHHQRLAFGGRSIDVLGIEFSSVRPHHAVREHPGILHLNSIYVRRGRTTSTLTPPEIEALYRERDAQRGVMSSRTPLRWGFINPAATDVPRTLTIRIRNAARDPVAGVDLIVDVVVRRDPSVLDRQHLLTGAVLQPNEARDIKIALGQPEFYKIVSGPRGTRSIDTLKEFGRFRGDQWLDVIAYVSYQDADGFVRSERECLAVS